MGAVAVGVGELAPETERSTAAAPMHIVPRRDPTRDLGREPDHGCDLVRDEERLLRRDVLILQVEAARLRRKARGRTLVIPG